MKRILTLFLSILLAVFTFLETQAQYKPDTSVESRLKTYVQLLASDSLEGRLPGTNGGNIAAEYIAYHFEKFGLKPFKPKDYLQKFSLPVSVKIGSNTSLKTTKKEFSVNKDFIPFGFSANGSVSANPIVFVGYGLIGKDIQYNDYGNVDVKGKTVLFLRGVPDPENPHSQNSKYSSLRYKVIKAREKGASAVLVVNSEQQLDSLEDVLQSITIERTGKEQIPVIHISRKTSNELLESSNKKIEDLEKQLSSNTEPNSFLLKSEISLNVSISDVLVEVPNVVGVVEGTDPLKKNEKIVIGAHYDHLGKGHNESSLFRGSGAHIHYGADDNASGTAGLIELAERIGKKPLERTVVFIAFTAEEMGLIGSKEYCSLPNVSLDNTIAMINMDMIGRMSNNSLQVQGVGTANFWNTLVDSLSKDYSLEMSKGASGQGPSDHSSFNSKNIPVLFVFTGLHSDYHRPSDTWDKINYEGQSKTVSFVESVVNYVSALPTRPEYVVVKADSAKKGTTNFRVYVGTIPDYSDHPRGMRITGVSEGSPAHKAGLQEGDVLIKFGTKSIANVYDYTYALAEYSPGQIIEVEFLRDGDESKKQTCSLTLGSRSNK